MGLIVVANNVVESRFAHVALHVGQMVKSFVTFGCRWRFAFWKCHRDFGRHEACVFHDAFCLAGMYTLAVNLERGACGVEIFVSDFTFVAAIDCVGVFCLEIVQV